MCMTRDLLSKKAMINKLFGKNFHGSVSCRSCVGLRWDQVAILPEQIVTDILIKVNFSRSVLMIRFG